MTGSDTCVSAETRSVEGALRIKLVSFIGLAIPFVVMHSIYAQRTVPVTLQELLSLKRPSELTLSPLGDFLSYTEGGKVYVLATKPGEKPLRIAEGEEPQWSPNGRSLAFLKNTDAGSRIVIWNRRRGTLSTVGTLEHGSTPKTSLRWGLQDDSVEVVVAHAQTSATHNEASVSSPVMIFPNENNEVALQGLAADSPNNAGTRRYSTDLYLFNSKTGQSRLLLRSAPNFGSLSWSPDGRKLLGAAPDPRPPGHYVPPSSTIFMVDASTGMLHKVRSIARNPGMPVAPKWSPDGTEFAYIAPAKPYMEGALFVGPSDGGGAPADITKNLDRAVFAFEWEQDSRSLVAQVADNATRPIVRLTSSSGSIEKLNDTGVLFLQFTISQRGDLAWIESTGSTFGIIRFRSAKARTSVAIEDLNPQISRWQLGSQEVVRWKNKEGENLEGILVKPFGYQRGHRYPLIVDPYGNRVNDFECIPMLANQMLADRGYALFFPNHRGPQTFAYDILKNAKYARPAWISDPAELESEDILSGVDALIAQGIADPGRLALYGMSNGASAVNLMLTKTPRFKAAISTEGVSDWFNYYMYRPADDWTIPDFLDGITPQDDLSLYLRISPLYHLTNVTTPLLLVTGDKDTRAIQAVLLYHGLRRLGKPVTLIRYPSEGHGMSSTDLEDYWARTEKFLSQHLLGAK